MRKTDFCASAQTHLVSVLEYPGVWAFVPPPTPRIVPLVGLHDELIYAHEALIELKTLTDHLPNPDIVMRTLDRREAVLSSQIEGTHSDINDLLTYEATGSDDGLPKDVLVTLNYVKALDDGLRKIRSVTGTTALNEGLILNLHAHLMEGVKDFKGTPGAFRQKQNWIGGFKINDARFVPPPATNVSDCIKDLVTFLQYEPKEDEPWEISIVLRMAIAHAQFEAIHPFIDGNGRVGRLLLPLMLAAEDYPPVYLAGFLKENQRDYYDTLLNVSLKNDWQAWVSFFAIGVKEATQDSIATAKRLVTVLDHWQSVVNNLGLRADSALNRLPDLLMVHPVASVNQVKELLNISFPTANAALSKFQELGFLQQSDSQRNRLFIAKEVIDILDGSSLQIDEDDEPSMR